MVRELGMNPKKFGKLANHKQEPWKAPLSVYVEERYFKSFGKRYPDKVGSIDQLVKDRRKRKEERKKGKKHEEQVGKSGEEAKDIPF